jgi:hypothetical protein
VFAKFCTCLCLFSTSWCRYSKINVQHRHYAFIVKASKNRLMRPFCTGCELFLCPKRQRLVSGILFTCRVILDSVSKHHTVELPLWCSISTQQLFKFIIYTTCTYNDRNKSSINNGVVIDLVLCYLITSG